MKKIEKREEPTFLKTYRKKNDPLFASLGKDKTKRLKIS